MFHEVLKQGKLSTSIIITFQVMTFAWMSPGYPHSVGSFSQSSQEKFWTHAPCAGNPDDPYVRWIYHPADTGKVSRAITAPVA
jgi:hypothetical protein